MSWLLNLASNPAYTLFLSLLFFLPSQLGRHFWPEFAYINGLRVDYLSPTLYLTDLLSILLLIETLPLLFLKVSKWKSFLVILPFIILAFSSSQSVSPLNSLLGVMRLLQIVIVAFFVAWYLSYPTLKEKTAIVLSGALLYTGVLTLFQFIYQGSIGGVWYWLGERTFTSSTPGIANASLNGSLILRPYATFPHPNVLSGFAVVMVTYLLFFYNSTWAKATKILALIAMGVGIGITIVTLSRVNFLILLVVSFIWILSRRSISYLNRILVFLLVVASLGILYTGGYSARLSDLGIHSESILIRTFLNQHAWDIFTSHLISGVGVQNFLPNLADRLSPLTPHSYFQPAHSVYLLLLAETGLLGGGLLFLGVALMVWRIMRSDQRVGKGVLLFTLLALGLTDHYLWTLHQGHLLAAFVFGVVWEKNHLTTHFTRRKVKNIRTVRRTRKPSKSLSSQPVKISRNGSRTQPEPSMKT